VTEKDQSPVLRGVNIEPLGPFPSAGPCVNARFRREGPVTNGARAGAPQNANNWRPLANMPGLKRGR
jgi:hypothetical protein